jgi:hypothetical protein
LFGNSQAIEADQNLRIAAPIELNFERIAAIAGKIGNIFFGPAFLVTVEIRNAEAAPMSDDWYERDEVVAAGSICPAHDCGALVISYRPSDRAGRDNARSWCEFACTVCGTDFTVPEDELIFQSVPKEWLLARVQAA